tara:strand:- start:1101 stop:1394 length:294 start_codon:yes stop_codon:yes gene_type:complete
MKILSRDNLIFGAVWGLISLFLGKLLVNAASTLSNFMETLLNVLITVFLGPLKIVEFFKVTDTSLKAGLIVAVAIILGPIARIIFVKIRDIFKKSPI